MPEGGIDPRAPRFAAAVTSVLLLAATFLALIGVSTARGEGWFAYAPPSGETFTTPGWVLAGVPIVTRVADPGFIVLAVIAALFAWSVISPRTAPWGVVFRRLIRPRLDPPAEREDPRPPRFAQGVGLIVTGAGLLLHVAGVPWALPVAAAAAFVAAFLNAAFGFCLGCQMYLLLQRTGLVGRES